MSHLHSYSYRDETEEEQRESDYKRKKNQIISPSLLASYRSYRRVVEGLEPRHELHAKISSVSNMHRTTFGLTYNSTLPNFEACEIPQRPRRSEQH